MEILDDNDVLHTGSSALMFQCTFKTSEYLALMQSKLEEEQLFGQGMDCEVLCPNQQWRKGKVRMCLEFESDTFPSDSANALYAVPQVPDEISQASFGMPAASFGIPQIPNGIPQVPGRAPQPPRGTTRPIPPAQVQELAPPLRKWVRNRGMWS
ncbi:MAG: KGK domain-containing protein [Microcoleaceae cyanobacterium]